MQKNITICKMKELSYLSGFINPSMTRDLFNKARQYNDVVDFTLGDPDIQPHDNIKQAAINAILAGKTRYSQNAGLLELREVIAEKYKYDYNISYNPQTEVFVSVGGMEGIFLALLSILNPNDEVIIPAPYWINYVQMVQMCGAKPIIVAPKSDTDLSISIDNVQRAISPKTKVIIINSPSNPSGIIIKESELNELASLSIGNDLYVIADEVYRKLIYNNRQYYSISKIAGMKERTIMVNSLSKEFCMTGWRLGYVVGPQDVIKVMTMLQENIAACAPLPSQHAAIEALCHHDEYSQSMIKEYERRKNVVVEEISKIEKLSLREPEATFYAMVNIKKLGLSSIDFAYQLLDKVHVALVPGITYGDCCEGFVRIAFTINEEQIREGIHRIHHFVESL